ncbi:hypothetical protein COZ40_02465 [Candidatus Roizmanbacteria bacterium CG_4_10_14_3_um_filter_39_13]|uniref:YYY membrane protein n=3 Tax=Candidatus Roizmaniibacteriota TaxID=1752723 RepID=A0A2M7EL96_9BACT|nr:MAG: hypothetical protein COS52_02600 [Candidatus Roizmanbacteria bacterium CG03_land_8_20_14_0_80_39_12]PIV71336.1 MAG: hypothetical protein COW57_00100 [Candidatus Roizmanbacteria bacterium CG17_big_fil_post_rev_8_21_14_2_50_39_7]PIX68593.1 MAG: hypothetical protein COZ40_02465 [Candidatus Roizmanbacteria bacterium CG_4_10_14_3_um_filter_39_13]
MDWIYQTLQWYFALMCLGVVFFGITKKLFHGFFDQGYAFSKTIGLLFLSYGVFLLSNLHILPFHELTLYLLLACAIGIGYWIQRNQKKEKINWIIFICEEFLFIAALFLWTYVRGQEPSIRGLEKFMDFGFMKSILRTSYFPPLDMWYAKLPINYYYFGHLTGAVQIKLSGIPAEIGYNLILATIFAQSIVSTFSLVTQIVYSYGRKLKNAAFFGLIGTWILNFGGNLHTIYLFTSGYPAEKPIPFWEILSSYNPAKYWYPNATRFIPFTIHEFPSYSYVVADLHGHVFDILFVLVTLALLFILFTKSVRANSPQHTVRAGRDLPLQITLLGFMSAVHYMTNAFDGPIYLLLTSVFLLLIFRFSRMFVIHIGILIGSFILFSLPFSVHFKPFVTAIGVNCSPSFLTDIGKLGPFLFEKGNCQPDELWMLFVLWGFFFISFLLFIWGKAAEKYKEHATDDYIFILFTFGIFLILIPEFFYIKDIYPAHFRANTMFKMGYQAFMMMSIASTYTFFVISRHISPNTLLKKIIWIVPFLFVGVYMFYAAPSYYGNPQKTPQLNGTTWLSIQNTDTQEIIAYLNKHITGQPVILEAQGDSYTDFNHVSAYTGLPTVAGWWVHEWLWRGSADAVGKRIPDVVALYESKDIKQTRKLLKKYDVSYVIVSTLERQKYKELQEAKFTKLGKKIFVSSNGFGALYQTK